MSREHPFLLLIPDDWSDVRVFDIPGLIAGTLEPYDKIGFSATKQAAIKKEHEGYLEKAILNGELVPRNRVTNSPEPFATGAQLKKSVVSVEEFQKYASQFGVEIIRRGDYARDHGRYNLQEAAQKIAEATGESDKAMLRDLEEAVRKGELSVHIPGSDATYEPTTVRALYEEAYWDDLNKWLERTHPRLEWRFIEPAALRHEDVGGMDGPKISKVERRALWIKQKAAEIFQNPLAIPVPGKQGLKKLALKESQLFTESTFDQAWKDAAKNGYVQMADVEKYRK